MILKENAEAGYIANIRKKTDAVLKTGPGNSISNALKYKMFKLIDTNVTKLFNTTDKTANFKKNNSPFYDAYCDVKPNKKDNDLVLAGVTSDFIDDVNSNFGLPSLGDRSKKFILAILQNHAYGVKDNSGDIAAFVESKFYFYNDAVQSDANIKKIIEIKKDNVANLPESCFFYFKTAKMASDAIKEKDKLSFPDIIVNAKADSIENPKYPHFLVFGNPRGVLRFSNPLGDDFNVIDDSDFKNAAIITIKEYDKANKENKNSDGKENKGISGNIPDVYKIGKNYAKGYFLPIGEEVYPLQMNKTGMPSIDLEAPVGKQKVFFDICPFFTLVTPKGDFSFIKQKSVEEVAAESKGNVEEKEVGTAAKKSRDAFSNQALSAFANYSKKQSYVGGEGALIRDASRFYRWVALLSLLETFDYASFENVRRVNDDGVYSLESIKRSDYCQRIIDDEDVQQKIKAALVAFKKKQSSQRNDEVANIILFLEELMKKTTIFEAANLIKSKSDKGEFRYTSSGDSFKINVIAQYLLKVKERGDLGEDGQALKSLNNISDSGGFGKKRIKFLLAEYTAQASVINESFIRNKIKSILVERYYNKSILKESEGSEDIPTKLRTLIDFNDNSVKDDEAKAYWDGLEKEYELPEVVDIVNSKIPENDAARLGENASSTEFVGGLKVYADKLIAEEKASEPPKVASKEKKEPAKTEPVAAPPPAPRKPQKVIQDANEKQAEVDYGYVGTFLRASVAITSRKKEAVTEEGEAEAKKEVQETRIRRAIRKMLIKEEEASPEADQVVADAAEQLLNSPSADVADADDGTEVETVEEVISDADLLNKLLSDVSVIFANTVWAIFCKFSNPNQALYAVCIQDPGNNFTGMTFNKAGISVLGQTKNELLGKVKNLLNTNLTITEFAVERIILEAIETSEEYGPADAQLKTGDLESAFDTDSSGKGDIKYRKLAQLFKEKRFNDTEFVSSMSLIKNYMADSNMLYDILMVDTNAKGVLQTDTKSIMRNAKASDPIAYKNAINTFNSSLSDTLRPGEKITFKIVKKKGASKDFVFKSDNKKHEKALNANAASFTDVLSNFLGESGLTGLQGSAAVGFSSDTTSDKIPEFLTGKSITIPAEAKYYTANINNKRSNNENIGMKAAIGGGKFKGFYVLPMLNEKQFYAVLLDYWTKGLKNKRQIRDSVRKNLSNVKQSYVTYKSNYKRFIERDMFKLLNDKRMKEGLRDFKSQYQDIVRGVYPETSEYFYFSESKVSQEIPGGARRLKRREKDTTETLDRKTNMYYIHSPGVMADPYDDFIRKIIIGCTNSNSAAENIQDEQVKIYENIFNRHQLLYKVYLKNKLRENIESKIKYKKKERIKNKIKDLLNEDYKEGDTMLSNLGSIAKMFKSQAPPKKTAPPKQASSDSKEQDIKQKGVKPIGEQPGSGNTNSDSNADGVLPASDLEADSLPFKEGNHVINSLPAPNRKIDLGDDTPFHHGIDFLVGSTVGIVPIKKGVVLSAGDLGNYGNTVVVKHDKYITLYAHFSKIPEGITVGEEVTTGDIIGYPGETGNATGVHLHMEIKDLDGKKNWESAFNWITKNETELGLIFDTGIEEEYEKLKAWLDNGSQGDPPGTGDYHRAH